MAYPLYLREKARSMRRDNRLTIDELAARLALSRSTIYYWVKDIPIARTERQEAAQRAASRSNRRCASRARELAYWRGWHSFHGLRRDPLFPDFVTLYIAEGYKRNRNAVSVANSDPAVIELAHRWISAFARNPVTLHIQYHEDQRLSELFEFWCNRLALQPAAIQYQRKSNSGQLSGRIWRNRFGVLSVRTSDTQLRSMLQAWMDCVQRQWLDSAVAGA